MKIPWFEFPARLGLPQPAPAGASPAPPTIYFAQGSGEPKRTVRAGRRRRDETPAGERERADAPDRDQRPDAGGAPPAPPARPPGGGTTGGGYSGGSSGSAPRPSGGSMLPGGGMLPGGAGCARNPIMTIAVIGLLIVLWFLFGRGGGDTGGEIGNLPEQGTQQDAFPQPGALPQQEALPAQEGGAQQGLPGLSTDPAQPTVDAAAAAAGAAGSASSGGGGAAAAPGSTGATAGGDTWTIMMYQDADDKILEKDIYVDLNEAERIGSTDNVKIVAQLDRYRGGYNGDGDWVSAKRYFVTRDNDLNRVGSQEVADLGEVDMSDGRTLVDFVAWAVENYPADKYMLIMADHGMGWPGGWSDPTARGGSDSRIPLTGALGGQLYLSEIDASLEEIRRVTGLDKFEVIGMDACLMSHIEVYSALAPHARYAIASQETEPALGWAYTGFLDRLVRNPAVSGAEVGQYVVESYIDEDQRIVDDSARAELTGRGSILDAILAAASAPPAAQVAGQMAHNVTLTAADLGAMPALMDAWNNLAYVMQGVDQKAVAKARSHTQSYTSIFGAEVPASYIDIGHFAQLATEASRNQQVGAAAQQVLNALDQFVVAERHGAGKPGSTGVSVYFPNSQLYRSPMAGPQSYVALADRFANDSVWDDFLAFHYTGRQFDPAAPAAVIPDRAAQVVAPGASAISISPVRLSADSAAPGEPIVISADIAGDNIGYIKLFVGYLDQDAASLAVVDTDYLESPDTREVNGVYYPEWGEGEFTLEFEWEPVVFAVSDGEINAEAVFEPESYGATFEDATYTVEGIYRFADGDSPRHARLYFRDNFLRAVYGFTNADAEQNTGIGAPWEITPEPGDTVTVLEQWLDLDQNGRVIRSAREEGETVTFSAERTLEWEELDAAAGQYVVGFIVEDLDGNQTAAYAPVTVR